MAQFQELTRLLLSAGGAVLPEGKGTYLLYNDRSSLTCKHWTGSSFGDQELVATSVRPNSLAAYLLTPESRLIICISSSSSLRALGYDEDVEDWVDDGTIPHFEVHPDGKLSGSLDVEGRARLSFQDPAGRLIHLNDWTPTVLPADPVAGSPISTVFDGDRIHIFYISAGDKCMHYVTSAPDGSWSDNVLTSCAVEEKLKRFIVAPVGESEDFEAYLLTAGDAVLQLTAEGGGEKRELGKVNHAGTFVPGRSAEASAYVWVNAVSAQPRPVRRGGW